MTKRHNQRCPECKEIVEILLRSIFGEVYPNYQLNLRANVSDYSQQPFFSNLNEIYNQLSSYRGYQNFVKVTTLPRVDYFIPNPGIILEFDESQHFTKPREISLLNYPRDLTLGYDRSKWLDLCRNINTRDSEPPYRDEQRAWYDTLRDFAPLYLGLRPTIRIFVRDLQWCSLNPSNDEDIEKFKKMINFSRI